MTPKCGMLVIPVEFGMRWNRSDITELLKVLESRLQQPVCVCFPDDPVDTYAANIRSFVSRGIRRLVILPLGPRDITECQVVAEKLIAARLTAADVHFHAMSPLSWIELSNWLGQFAAESQGTDKVVAGKTGVVLATRGGQDPFVDADLPRLAYLISRVSPVQNLSHAFIDGSRPHLADAISSVVKAGAENVLVVPWLADDATLVRIEYEMQIEARSQGVSVSIASPTLTHPGMIDIIVSKYQAGCSDNRLQMYLDFVAQYERANSKSPLDREAESELSPQIAGELAELDRKLNALLPPEYQGQYESVQPTSMGTAGLKYDSEGKVAWDEIWTSFCDLALAGGPPHRGTLLEAVTSAEVLAEPEQYQIVVKEIERGIRLVTRLPLITSRNLGWVGVICESEEMAVWLMRAIIVENVMVRREGDILYLPAGPKFTVKREIKNVITAIAKTVHYWKAHLVANRKPREGV